MSATSSFDGPRSLKPPPTASPMQNHSALVRAHYEFMTLAPDSSRPSWHGMYTAPLGDYKESDGRRLTGEGLNWKT
jgi:hypothetical protein